MRSAPGPAKRLLILVIWACKNVATGQAEHRCDMRLVCESRATTNERGVIDRSPRWVKIMHSAFVVVLFPTYWRQYGPGNFLWFSDVALLTSVPALWFESSLLASTQASGVVVLESLWLVDFAAGLIAKKYPIGLASYMVDRRIPRFVRALSLVHRWLTPV